MRLPRSLRWRLTVAFGGAAAVAGAALTVGILTLAQRAVWAPLDRQLREEAETLAAVWRTATEDEIRNVAVSVGTESDFGPKKFLRLVAANGAEVVRLGSDPVAEPRHRTLPGIAFRTVMARGSAYRFVSDTDRDGRLIEIAVSARSQLHTLSLLRAGVFIGALSMVVFLAALAWAIAVRATRDLEAVAADLETIEAGALNRRLDSRQTTEADRLVEVLNRLLGRLEAAMEHLRRFTADAAHELRTPVAALRAHLDAKLSRARSGEELRDGMLDALEHADRLGRLAEDLLTLSAIEARGVEPLDGTGPVALGELVQEVAESLQPIAQEQGRPFAVVVEAAAEIEGSTELLKRALTNLVDNAFRHTPADAAVELRLCRTPDAATIEVRDAGPGIPTGETARLFARFHRLVHTRSGSGLGLAICREICRAHGGDVTLRAAPGGGTIARVTLPLRAATPFILSSRSEALARG
jgi:signal transduction histidine kinase